MTDSTASPAALAADFALSGVSTTVATLADARRLAQAVLAARLAACVQVEPIGSHYVWQGAAHEEPELRLLCKTAVQAVPALLALLRAHHPYGLPELIVQPLQATAEYGAWVVAQVVAAPGAASGA